MISAILLINQKGEIVISRFYRDNVSRSAANEFRLQVIAAKETGSTQPIKLIDKTSFLYLRHEDMYIVVATKLNALPGVAFEFLYQLLKVFKAYFEGKFNEAVIRNNFVLLYELLDEVMDYGYPQILSVDFLLQYIKNTDADVKKVKSYSAQMDEMKITSEITGAIDWRQDGKYKYRKNEVFIDVMESVNLLISTKGETLRNDVSGKVMMKTYLTGMPECKFGLNDKLMLESDKKRSRKGKSGIAIEDIRFHRCVRLGKYETDRTISFIPPDGEFEAMSYRVTQNINPPFNVIPVVQEAGRSRIEYDIKIKGNFSNKLFATNVVVKIPTPKNTAKHKVTSKRGRTKYDPTTNHLLWKFRKFPGDASYQFRAVVTLVASMSEKTWTRPPITVEFQVPMFTASGMHVRFLKITEKSNYDTIKWVRYITKAGSYQIRI